MLKTAILIVALLMRCLADDDLTAKDSSRAVRRTTKDLPAGSLARKANDQEDILEMNPLVIQRLVQFPQGANYTGAALQCTRKKVYFQIAKSDLTNIEFSVEPENIGDFSAFVAKFLEWAKVAKTNANVPFRKKIGRINDVQYMFTWNVPDGSDPYAELSVLNRNTSARLDDVMVLSSLIKLVPDALAELDKKEKNLRDVDALLK